MFETNFKEFVIYVRKRLREIKARNPYLYRRVPQHLKYFLGIVFFFYCVNVGITYQFESGYSERFFMAVCGILISILGIAGICVFITKISWLMAYDAFSCLILNIENEERARLEEARAEEEA